MSQWFRVFIVIAKNLDLFPSRAQASITSVPFAKPHGHKTCGAQTYI